MRLEHPPVPVMRPVPATGALHRSRSLPRRRDARERRHGTPARRGREQRGDTYAFVLLLPATIVLVLLLAVHAFIVVNARSEASVAASEGLRAIWRQTGSTPLAASARLTPDQLALNAAEMAGAAEDAVIRVTGREGAWRWWSPGATTVYSDRCGGTRPDSGTAGWARVVVSGEAIGPLSWLWPDRSDAVYASAEGPAVLSTHGERFGSPLEPVPEQWSQSDLARC